MKKNYISVCKNVIMSNNKRGWEDPDPAIRVSTSPSGKAVDHCFEAGILDENGKIVARIITTKDGTPVLKSGAKVAIVTEYPVINLN
jgi:hypothetical protein